MEIKTTKPFAEQTMLINKAIDNVISPFILNLSDIGYELFEDKALFKLYATDDLNFEDGHYQITISDDPYMTHAGDWTNLGCSRLKFNLLNAKVTKKENYYLFETELNNLKSSRLLPERRIDYGNHVGFDFY